jgi:CBS domain-containing protein
MFALEKHGGDAMDAGAIMTRAVVTVGPDTTVSDVASIMLKNRISAVPVLDQAGALVGIISEGDLLRRAELGTEHRRSRWMELGFSNVHLAADYVKEHGRKASDVMTRTVITVRPETEVAEIANILESRHIKRVPVVVSGRLVGIVSRTNIVQALASGEKTSESAAATQDRDIQEALHQAMRKRRWAFLPSQGNIVVRDGVVHLWGYIESEEARRAITVIAENIKGVRGVEDHMDYPPIHPGF